MHVFFWYVRRGLPRLLFASMEFPFAIPSSDAGSTVDEVALLRERVRELEGRVRELERELALTEENRAAERRLVNLKDNELGLIVMEADLARVGLDRLEYWERLSPLAKWAVETLDNLVKSIYGRAKWALLQSPWDFDH